MAGGIGRRAVEYNRLTTCAQTALATRLAAALADAPRGVVSAYLHGSHARERQHAESDVDVGLLLDYHALRQVPDFPGDLVEELARLPGFRNVLIHAYVELDLSLAVDTLDRLDAVREFVRRVANLDEVDPGT